MTQPVPEDTANLLTRLSQKPGVQSTLVISRADGAIVRASGLISFSSTASVEGGLSASDNEPSNENGDTGGSLRRAEDVARIAWTFFRSAGELASELEHDDDVKLLRLRTRKHELVIVPDAKFVLVVIHDTPPA